jgi:hypothetical protein
MDPGGCLGKVEYPTPQAALAVANIYRKLVRAEGRDLCIYKCHVCGHWHCGGIEGTPDRRRDWNDKQWKNWHWRKAAELTA